ncbi:type VI secretion system tube protein TssD [Spirosoma litoris]
MAYEGKLSIEGDDYNINWMLLRVIRDEDKRGVPSSRPEWGLLIGLDALEDSKIKNWMIDPHMQKDGKVVLNRIDEDATYKEIEFKKAYCSIYRDEFFADQDYLKTTIFIVGSEITFNKATLKVV